MAQQGILTTQFGFKPNPVSEALVNSSNRLMGFGLGLVGHDSPKAALRGAAQGLYQGTQADNSQYEKLQAEQRKQQYAQRIRAMGADFGHIADALEDGVIENADAWNAALKQKSAAKNGPDAPSSVREWEYFNKLTPEQRSQYLRMKRSNPYLNTGTGFVSPDPINPGQTVGAPIAIDNFTPAADKASGNVMGEAGAEATLELGGTLAKGEQTIQQLEALKSHPGLKETFGWQAMTPAIPGTPKADFRARLDQIQGGAFLQAFETLKGGGQITEVEGKKATDAIFRANKAQSEAEFIAAVDEFIAVIKTGMERAKSKVSGDLVAPGSNGSMKSKYGLE